ncbi:hypothetical protein QVD17_25459 [Tagetes erecta]|uniref:Sulfotransferase n=1 Tax=Tagetes erecta TaxID=13708 RepID=A0AAD8KGC3_TARER|nr:hypothetical protein QVD17_25459 [Tagetes erecta]
MEKIKTYPQHTCSWLKGRFTLYKYQEAWNHEDWLDGEIFAQQNFIAHPNDVFLCSYPKSGTTWLKALTFAIVTREKFDESTSPLLKTLPHRCIPFLEKDLVRIEESHKNSSFLPVNTHLQYNSLPESIITSNYKIVYIYRNMKDVIVSYYHFMKEIVIPMENASFEEAFDEFCEGISSCGPYWDHILGYWKASLSRPKRFLFLKYEDMKEDPTSNVKRLAEFIGRPFTIEEEKANVIEKIITLCSFENLSNLDVNKSGKHRPEECNAVENRLFFRKAKDGDWKNYFTQEMIEKVDKLIDEKFGVTGLVLK